MKQAFAILAVLVMTGSVLLAAETTKSGILLDAMCGEMSASNAERVGGHKVACALMPNCDASGFGIVVGGEFLKFDDPGDEKARTLLKATKKKSQVKVQVTGDFGGEQVKVSEIKELD